MVAQSVSSSARVGAAMGVKCARASYRPSTKLLLARVERLREASDLLALAGDAFEIGEVFDDELALALERVGVGRALLAVVAVGAVGVEARGVLRRGLRLPPERLDVGERVGELLLGARRLLPDAMAQHPEGQLHLLRPRPEAAHRHLVEAHLQRGVDLVAGEELVVGLVVDDLDGLVVDPVDAVDEAQDLEGPDRQPEFLLDGEDVAVVDDALLGDEAPEDGEPLGEDVHAGELLGAPRLAIELDGTLLGERARALVVDDLLDEALEDGVDGLAEAERQPWLGLLLLDVVETVRERAGLEPREPAVAEMLVLERRDGGHERSSTGRSRRSGLLVFAVFSNATMCEPGNTLMTRASVAACSGVISLRSRPVYAGTSHTSP
jgi:hypothetical protein